MDQSWRPRIRSIPVRQGLFVLGLLTFVFWVNWPILAYDLIYAEQPILFTANQAIHSVSDLLNIYLHPQMLNIFSIPFFRPSGHFLMYQLLTPWMGWHSNQGFIAVNLLFLGLSGLMMARIYALLFPGYTIGGYIAFAVYLMHPALILSRLIALHFEFAYVFFTLLSLYCFMRFCANWVQQIKQYSQLLAALFFYVLAVTFKEPALLLGPLLGLYFCLAVYRDRSSLGDKENWQILGLLAVISLSLAFYLTLAWPTIEHPLRSAISPQEKLAAATVLLKNLFGFASEPALRAALAQAKLFWREVVFTPASRWLLWGLTLCVLISLPRLGQYKKSLFFLVVSALAFFILPVNWAMGLPWHLSLTLLFLSFIWGLGVDTLLNHKMLGLGIAILIGCATLGVNHANIHYLETQIGYPSALLRNALDQAPPLQAQLNAESVLVVEDSVLHDPYDFGNGAYPLYLMKINYDGLERIQDYSFLKYQATFNGYLFKWVYELPSLQEEIFPFRVESMNEVPDAMIHEWLEHFDNIFCLGYDAEGHWQDKTAAFKQNLKQQQAQRFMHVHAYQPKAATYLSGKVMYTKQLAYPDHHVCRYECDQNMQCQGFTYEAAEYGHESSIKCQFFDELSVKDDKFCATCIGFVKVA